MKPAYLTQPRLMHLLLLISLVAVFPLDVLLTSLPEIASRFEIVPQALSAQLAAFPVIVAVGQLLAGQAAERWGLKPVFLCCGALTLLATLGILCSTHAWQFQWLRGLQALGCAGYGLSNAMVQVQLEPAMRAKARVVMTTASGVFISTAPLFGAMLQGLAGWRASFAVYALLVGAVLWYAYRAPSGHPPVAASTAAVPTGHAPGAFWLNSVLCALAFSVHFSFIVASPLLFMERYALSSWAYAGLLLVYGACYVAGGWLAAKACGRIPAHRQVGWGCALMLGGGLSMVLLQNHGGWQVPAILLPALVSVCGVCLVRPAATCLAMDARQQRPASAAAALGTVTFVAGGSLSWVATTLLGWGDQWLGYWQALMAAASCLLAWLPRSLLCKARAAT